MGIFYAHEFIINQLKLHVDLNDIMIDTNYKDMLMRYTQARGISLPEYVLENEDGPNHDKSFCIRVSVENAHGVGTAKNKKQAEQDSAYQALSDLRLL
jgi:dsRNA-specific ribonuclease